MVELTTDHALICFTSLRRVSLVPRALRCYKAVNSVIALATGICFPKTLFSSDYAYRNFCNGILSTSVVYWFCQLLGSVFTRIHVDFLASNHLACDRWFVVYFWVLVAGGCGFVCETCSPYRLLQFSNRGDLQLHLCVTSCYFKFEDALW